MEELTKLQRVAQPSDPQRNCQVSLSQPTGDIVVMNSLNIHIAPGQIWLVLTSPEEVAVCVVKGSFKMYKNQYRPFATLPLSADHPETERVDRVQVDAYIGQLGDPAGLPLVDRLLVDTPALFLFKFPSSNEALYQHGGLGPGRIKISPRLHGDVMAWQVQSRAYWASVMR